MSIKKSMTASEMGRKGGKRCLETMTPRQRQRRAKKASLAAARARSEKAAEK